MPDFSIINFNGIGQLAKPIEKLIEKVSAGIGMLHEPTRIRRKAKAEAEAKAIEVRNKIAMDKLLAQAEIENVKLGQRALHRFVQEEVKAQQNMEDVLKGATHYLNEDAQPEKMDNDWMTHFFGKCRAVSNKEMQDLWSKILAGEANHPGSFSKRTVEFVSTISKGEAETFTRLCRHVWVIHGEPIPLVHEVDSDICKGNGIFYAVLKNLDSLGLIYFDGFLGYKLRKLPGLITASYCGEIFQLPVPEKKKGVLIVGKVLFSPMGLELFRITDAPRLEGMVEHTRDEWCKKGYTPLSTCPRA